MWGRKVKNRVEAFLYRAFEAKVCVVFDQLGEMVDDVVGKLGPILKVAHVNAGPEHLPLIFFGLDIWLGVQVKAQHDLVEVLLGRKSQIVERVGSAVVEDDEIHAFDDFWVECEVRRIEENFAVLRIIQ